ncbi:MAG: glutaminase A [Gammaproteobacteria bacterium]
MVKNNTDYLERINSALQRAVLNSRSIKGGRIADYIPELKNVDHNYVSAATLLSSGELMTAGDSPDYLFTMQSVSKLVLLIGLMEEFGSSKVFSWIKVEPSEQSFASIRHLDQYGPVPSNPLINAGAIALSGRIPGNSVEQQEWVHYWTKRLFGDQVSLNNNVFNSELQHADRNRSLAYLMKSTGVLVRDVEEVLIPYFMLCSFQVNIKQATYLPMLLAHGGLAANGERIISEETSNQVVSIMATCGLYNESGMHLVKTGLPAKSGISGLIIAVATGRAGIAVFSPYINSKGTSIRGHVILMELSKSLGWHFAAAN